MISIEITKVAGCIRGIIWQDVDGMKNIIDIAENENADVMLDHLFDQHGISAVRMDDGSLDAGDELSVREVAELACLNFND